MHCSIGKVVFYFSVLLCSVWCCRTKTEKDREEERRREWAGEGRSWIPRRFRSISLEDAQMQQIKVTSKTGGVSALLRHGRSSNLNQDAQMQQIKVTTNTGRVMYETATCLVEKDPSSNQAVRGIVVFKQAHNSDKLEVSVDLSGFRPEPDLEQDKLLYGFHVHEYGNIIGGCESTGGLFNPLDTPHGAPNHTVRHHGDFGNLQQTQDGRISTRFYDHTATLFGNYSIVGRAIVVHANTDDLGRGEDASSLANGNSGPGLACCVIGWGKPRDNK